MKLNFSKPTKFEWIALCIFLACVALCVSTFYGVSRGLRWQSVKPGMYREVVADILIPIESRYNITDKKWRYRDCSIKLPPDDTVELSIRLDPEAGELAFDIASDVYELKKKSPVLSKKPLELEIWVRDPKCGVNLHVSIPGAPDHKKKRDIEEYQELARKWEGILRQEAWEELRAAAGDADEHGEGDPASQQTPE